MDTTPHRINIDDLTLGQMRDLQQLLATRVPALEPEHNIGKQIIVLDRGFVYVGDTTIKGDYITVKNAKNLRRWGTSKGLGELSEGPMPNTIADPVAGALLIPARAVIHFIAIKKGWD